MPASLTHIQLGGTKQLVPSLAFGQLANANQARSPRQFSGGILQISRNGIRLARSSGPGACAAISVRPGKCVDDGRDMQRLAKRSFAMGRYGTRSSPSPSSLIEIEERERFPLSWIRPESTGLRCFAPIRSWRTIIILYSRTLLLASSTLPHHPCAVCRSSRRFV